MGLDALSVSKFCNIYLVFNSLARPSGKEFTSVLFHSSQSVSLVLNGTEAKVLFSRETVVSSVSTILQERIPMAVNFLLQPQRHHGWIIIMLCLGRCWRACLLCAPLRTRPPTRKQTPPNRCGYCWFWCHWGWYTFWGWEDSCRREWRAILVLVLVFVPVVQDIPPPGLINIVFNAGFLHKLQSAFHNPTV